MMYWPVPDSYTRSLPENGSPGAFWEDRGDRHHCGIDIYAPQGSAVLAMESGHIIEVGPFTSPKRASYWNVTYYIFIGHPNGFIGRYAELGEVLVKPGGPVKAGQVIGHVGSVLDLQKIDASAPLYIQALKQNGHQSMLHFELYEALPPELPHYSGGNVLNGSKPDYLINPTNYLKTIKASL